MDAVAAWDMIADVKCPRAKQYSFAAVKVSPTPAAWMEATEQRDLACFEVVDNLRALVLWHAAVDDRAVLSVTGYAAAIASDTSW